MDVRPFALLAMLAACAACAADSLPVEISTSDSRLRYIGRFDTSDAKGPRCAWSASAVTFKFRGTAANVKLNEMGSNYYQVIVDGKATTVLAPEKGERVYSLASGLSDGEHTIQFVKRTEAMVGVTQITGIQLSAGGALMPLEAPALRIEVIGDSISCGYGNEGANQNERFKPETENAWLTYGAIASRNVNADYVCIAWSGRKMWPDNTIPEIYDRTLPSDHSSSWDFSKWTPDVVLINLATNDFGKGNPDEKSWTDAYKAFIARLRKHYPAAVIYLASGSMMSDAWPPNQKSRSTLHRYLNAIIDDLKKAGDANLRFIAFDPQDQKNGIGSDWHPSVKTHELMAAKFVEALRKDVPKAAAK